MASQGHESSGATGSSARSDVPHLPDASVELAFSYLTDNGDRRAWLLTCRAHRDTLAQSLRFSLRNLPGNDYEEAAEVACEVLRASFSPRAILRRLRLGVRGAEGWLAFLL